jgi:hypothetical protein
MRYIDFSLDGVDDVSMADDDGTCRSGFFLVDGMFPDQSVLTQAADVIKVHVGNVSRERWTDLLAEIRNFPERFSPELIQTIKAILVDDWQSKLHLLSYEGTIKTELIVPAVILFYLPVGLRGFLLGVCLSNRSF